MVYTFLSFVSFPSNNIILLSRISFPFLHSFTSPLKTPSRLFTSRSPTQDLGNLPTVSRVGGTVRKRRFRAFEQAHPRPNRTGTGESICATQPANIHADRSTEICHQYLKSFLPGQLAKCVYIISIINLQLLYFGLA